MKRPITFTTHGYRPGAQKSFLPTVTLHEPGLTDNHRIILTTFFRLQALLQGYKQVEARRPEDAVGKDMATVWSLMREAHVFEFTSDFHSLLYHEADVYTVEHVIGEQWTPAREVTEEEKAKIEEGDYLERMIEAGATYPYPEKLPFPVIFLAWGGGVPVPPLNREALVIPNTIRDLTTFGFVITKRDCWEIMIGKTDVKNFGKVVENLAMVLKCHYLDGRWDRSSILALAPWMVGAVVGAINDNESFIESHPSSLWDRQTRARFIKKEKRLFIPRPYYTVTIKPQHVKERMIRDSLVKRQIELSYRFDRRGNWASRVMRGKLSTLTDEVRKKLTKRKYKIWTRANMPDAEAMALLMKWHQSPPAFDEYVATLRWWRHETVVGKEELPYIPSTRKLAKGEKNNRG